MKIRLSQLRRIIREVVESEVGPIPEPVMTNDFLGDPNFKEFLRNAKEIDRRGQVTTGDLSSKWKSENDYKNRENMITALKAFTQGKSDEELAQVAQYLDSLNSGELKDSVWSTWLDNPKSWESFAMQKKMMMGTGRGNFRTTPGYQPVKPPKY